MQSSATIAPSTRDDRGRRLRRRLLGALGVAVLAVGLSGCVIIKSNSSAQLNTIGGVQVTTSFCASDIGNPPANSGYNPQDPACQKFATGGNANAGGNSNIGSTDNSNMQLLIAYRIPTNVTAPSTITTTSPSGGSAITFSQSSSYATQLQSLSAAGSGKQWVGYISTAISYTKAGTQVFTVAPTFALNQAADGSPFTGPFNYRVVSGFRSNDASHLSSRAVSCGSDAFSPYNNDSTGICIDDPSSSTMATDLSQTTRDVGVVPGTSTTVHAGATATAPFTVKFTGPGCFCAWTIAATTDIPGATATPNSTSLSGGSAFNTADNVTVTVPANTTPGTYHVTETADFAGSPTRSGTATVVVGNSFDFDTAPDIPNLPGLTLNGQSQTTTRQMSNFSVNDTSASPSGWNVTVQGDSSAGKSAAFKQYCPAASAPCGSDAAGYVSGGRQLAANSLTHSSTGASWTGGTGSAPTFNCASGCFVDAASGQKIASAASGSAGTGLWSTTGFSASSLSLATPTTLRVLPTNEQYNLDLVWTLNSGP